MTEKITPEVNIQSAWRPEEIDAGLHNAVYEREEGFKKKLQLYKSEAELDELEGSLSNEVHKPVVSREEPVKGSFATMPAQGTLKEETFERTEYFHSDENVREMIKARREEIRAGINVDHEVTPPVDDVTAIAEKVKEAFTPLPVYESGKEVEVETPPLTINEEPKETIEEVIAPEIKIDEPIQLSANEENTFTFTAETPGVTITPKETEESVIENNEIKTLSAENIANAKSLKELSLILMNSDGIDSPSAGHFSGTDLAFLIQQVDKGFAYIEEISREFGLREKVYNLITAEGKTVHSLEHIEDAAKAEAEAQVQIETPDTPASSGKYIDSIHAPEEPTPIPPPPSQYADAKRIPLPNQNEVEPKKSLLKRIWNKFF